MNVSLLEVLCCPGCAGSLRLVGVTAGPRAEQGALDCETCGASWPIIRGIPRFVLTSDYTENFGIQWNYFRSTQLDSYTGQPISARRFWRSTGWNPDALQGKMVLDAGCGAGRFAEVALEAGAHVVAVDFSSAIDAAAENLQHKGAIDFIQADINALPFRRGTFPFVFCMGVVQHTPEPTRTFHDLEAVTASGGRLAIDIYPKLLRNVLASKYWIRPLTRRIPPATTFRIFERCFPTLYAVSCALNRVPGIGRYLQYAVPVANHSGRFDLSEEQLRNWALLDTFDMWAPAYDRPQSRATVERWFAESGFSDIEIFRDGFLVGRGIKD